MTITPEVANHVLHYYGEGGYPPGGFFSHLLGTIARADLFNRDRLGLGFPEYVAAMTLAMEEADGLAKLKEVAS